MKLETLIKTIFNFKFQITKISDKKYIYKSKKNKTISNGSRGIRSPRFPREAREVCNYPCTFIYIYIILVLI